MALTAETARAVLAQAKADETYEAPIPEDDETAIFEATELVDQARAAWEANIRGPEVEAILRLAASGDEDGDGDGEPEADGDPEGDGDGEENLAEIEPWEDYDKDSAADVKSALDWTLENDADGFMDVARHVWEYESSNKNRKGIVEYLSKLAEQAGGGSDAETPQEPETPTEPEVTEPTPESEPDPEPEPEEAPKPARKRPAPKAEPEATVELTNGTLTITREQLIEAFANGSVEIAL